MKLIENDHILNFESNLRFYFQQCKYVTSLINPSTITLDRF